MKTTLNAIRKHSPCSESWEALLKSLGKTTADGTEVSYEYILDLLGVDDAIWALVCHEDQSLVRKFACDCAEHVLHIFEKERPEDSRPRKAIEVARLYAEGKATDEERVAARDAAGVAAGVAAGAAARDAARAAARDAAGDAARAAARDAAGAAARAAAGDAAGDAAWAAARAAERKWQEELFREYFCAQKVQAAQ